jgi:hypothetical protein
MVAVNAKNIGQFVVANADKRSRLQTDESRLYPALGTTFAAHETVNHGAKEYARGKGDGLVTINTAESYFGVFKRGMVGVFQHCGESHEVGSARRTHPKSWRAACAAMTR